MIVDCKQQLTRNQPYRQINGHHTLVVVMVRKQVVREGRGFSRTGNTIRRNHGVSSTTSSRARPANKTPQLSALAPEQVEAAHRLANLREFIYKESGNDDRPSSNSTRTRKVSASCRRRRCDKVKDSQNKLLDESAGNLAGLASRCPDAILSFNNHRRWEQLWDPDTARSIVNQKTRQVPVDAYKNNSIHRKKNGLDLSRSASHILMCEINNDVDECRVIGATSKKTQDSHTNMSKTVEQLTNSKTYQSQSTNRGEGNAVARSPLSITLKLIQEPPRRMDYQSLQAIRSSASESLAGLMLEKNKNGKDSNSSTLHGDPEIDSLIKSTGKDIDKRCRSLHRAMHFRQPPQHLKADEEKFPWATSSRRPFDDPWERHTASLRDIAAQEIKRNYETNTADHMMLQEGATECNGLQIVPQAFPGAARGAKSCMVLQAEKHNGDNFAQERLQRYIVGSVIDASKGALTKTGAIAILETNGWDLPASCQFAALYCTASRGNEGKAANDEWQVVMASGDATPETLFADNGHECLLCLGDGFSKKMGEEVPGCGHWFCHSCIMQYAELQVQPAVRGKRAVLLRCPVFPGCRYALDPVLNRPAACATTSDDLMEAHAIQETPLVTQSSLEQLGTRITELGDILLSLQPPMLQQSQFPCKSCRDCGNVLLLQPPTSAAASRTAAGASGAAMAHCSCGSVVCLECGQQGHFPATCKEMREWDTIGYMTTNIKQCPRCRHGIFKDGGCNHVRCRCGLDFCWACLTPLSSHSYSRCQLIQQRNSVASQGPSYLLSSTRQGRACAPIDLDLVSGAAVINRQLDFIACVHAQFRRRDPKFSKSPFFATLCALLRGASVVLGLQMQRRGFAAAVMTKCLGMTSPQGRLEAIVEGMNDLVIMVNGDPSPSAHSEQLEAILTKIVTAAGVAAEEIRTSD